MTIYYFIFALVASISYIVFFYLAARDDYDYTIFSPTTFILIMATGISYKRSFGLMELTNYSFHADNALLVLLLVSLALLPIFIYANKKSPYNFTVFASVFAVLMLASIFSGTLVEVDVHEVESNSEIVGENVVKV